MRLPRVTPVSHPTLSCKIDYCDIETVDVRGDDRKQKKHTVEERVSAGEASKKSYRKWWEEYVACCDYETLEEWDAHVSE